MIQFIRYILVAFTILLVVTVHSQETSIDSAAVDTGVALTEGAPKTSLAKAMRADRFGDVYDAIQLYSLYLVKKPEKIYAIYRLAENYKKARDYENAIIYYKKVLDAEPPKIEKKYPLTHWSYAEMLMQNGQYQQALDAFKVAEKQNYQSVEQYYIKERIKGCIIALDEKRASSTRLVRFINLNINKEHTELSPLFIDKGEIAYSGLPDYSEPIDVKEMPDKKHPNYKFYKAERLNDTTWKRSGEWKDMNIEGGNTGNGTFSPDGKRFYFSKCLLWDDGSIKCQIYFTEDTDSGWVVPVPLGPAVNKHGYSSTQPTMAKNAKGDREILYFVSDMPGGAGNNDIWYAILDPRKDRSDDPVNFGFKDAKNIGKRINTKGNEVTPFYDLQSGTIYYSTDFTAGFGGYDVFQSKGNERKWENPTNIGDRYNTSYDEMYYVLSPFNRQEGMLVSNRPETKTFMHSTCCDDILMFNTKNLDKLYVNGRVFEKLINNDSITMAESEVLKDFALDAKTEDIVIDSTLALMVAEMNAASDQDKTKELLPKAGVTVYLIDSLGDKTYLFSDLTDKKGAYVREMEPNKEYELEFEKEGYISKTIKMSTRSFDWDGTITMPDVTLNKIPREAIRIQILYEFGSYVLTKQSKEDIKTDLLPFLVEAPDLIVEISAHTDSVGSKRFNQELSQRRAQSVVDELVKYGVDQKRLIAVGYGEQKPRFPNTNPDGSDNKNNRAKNRRTEIKIIGSLDNFSKLNTTGLEITKQNTEAREQMKQRQREQ